MTAELPYALYLLVDPITKKIRYVGKTKQRPTERLRRHVWDALEKLEGSWVDRTHRANWIRSVVSAGWEPMMEILCRYATLEEVNAAERFFIYHIRAVRLDLTNATAGGDGCVVPRRPAVTDEVVIADYKSGMSSRKIAEKHGTCRKRVLEVLRHSGVAVRPAGRPRQVRA